MSDGEKSLPSRLRDVIGCLNKAGWEGFATDVQEAIEEIGRLRAGEAEAAPAGLDFARCYDTYMRCRWSGPDEDGLSPTTAIIWRQCLAFIAKAEGR